MLRSGGLYYMQDSNNVMTSFLAKGRRLPTLCFALFFGWLLSLPFEGGVLSSLLSQYPQSDESMITTVAIIAHFSGLFSCGFFFKKRTQAKSLLTVSGLICIACSVVLAFPYSPLWVLSVGLMSLLAGFCVASWSFWFLSETVKNERLQIAADILIYSNVVMILCNVIAENASATIGLVLSIALITLATVLSQMLPDRPEGTIKGKEPFKIENYIAPKKPFSALYLFVTIITINSGLMYCVVGPAFEHLTLLTSWYWAVPYIAALVVMKKLQKGTNRQYCLTVAIAMIGASFVFFAILDRSALSYIIIDTLMLGACGICDIFWWSILGEMLDFSKNPPRMLGMGLSANILGIILGSFVAKGVETLGSGSLEVMTNIAVGIVFVIIVILPLLYRQLSTVLTDHSFALELREMTSEQKKDVAESLSMPGEFTDREREITEKLLQGKTYKLIAEELFITENTIKFHMKNIYSKLGVHNKTELLKVLEEKRTGRQKGNNT